MSIFVVMVCFAMIWEYIGNRSKRAVIHLFVWMLLCSILVELSAFMKTFYLSGSGLLLNWVLCRNRWRLGITAFSGGGEI